MEPRGSDRILYVSDPSTVVRMRLPDPADEQHIRAWIDDIADSGIDLFNQEIFSQGWTAWWRSDRYHYDQRHQHRRFQKMFDAGIQPLDVIIDHCHKRGLRFIGGIRINDGHAYQAREQGLDIAEFIASHPEYQLTDLPEGLHYTRTEPLDFTHEAVRAFTHGVIEEILDRFDVDGIELCFRDCAYFPIGRVPERAHLMTEMVQHIRSTVQSRSSETSRDIILGARVHATPAETSRLGLDVSTWIASEWLDYVSPQDTMYADFNLPYSEWSAITRESECLLYPGMLPWTSIRARYRNKRIPLSSATCRALAHTMYACGADGISIYNHFVPSLWTPPFYPQRMMFVHQIGDPSRVERGERHYIFDPTYDGQTGFGAPDVCATGVAKANRLILERQTKRPSGHYPFMLYEDFTRIHGATLLFRGTGLTPNDRLDVRLNGHLIPEDTVGRTAESDASPATDGTLTRTEDGSEIPCVPEQGFFDGRSEPTPVFSTRWFRLSTEVVVLGINQLTVQLVRSDPDARSSTVVIDEIEVFVEPK